MANIDKEQEVEIKEEDKEETLPEGVVVTSKNEKNIGKTIGKVVAVVAAAGIMVGGYLYCNSTLPERNYSIQEVVKAESPYTVLDEAIINYDGEREDGIVSRLDSYVELVEISERLHAYDLASITEGLNHLEVPETIDITDLNEKLDEFDNYLRRGVSDKVLSKDSENFVRLALYLEAQEKAVNLTVQGSAFNDLASLKLLVLKSKVADCCEFPAESIDSMILSTFDGERMIRYTGETGKVYNIRFSTGSLDLITSCNMVPDLMDSVFADQSYPKEATTSYNGELNQRLLDEIKTTKTFIKMECNINRDGELVLDAPVAIQRFAHIFRKSEEDSK